MHCGGNDGESRTDPVYRPRVYNIIIIKCHTQTLVITCMTAVIGTTFQYRVLLYTAKVSYMSYGYLLAYKLVYILISVIYE